MEAGPVPGPVLIHEFLRSPTVVASWWETFTTLLFHTGLRHMGREQNDSSFLVLIYSFISSATPEKTILLTVAKMTITVTATGLVVAVVTIVVTGAVTWSQDGYENYSLFWRVCNCPPLHRIHLQKLQETVVYNALGKYTYPIVLRQGMRDCRVI